MKKTQIKAFIKRGAVYIYRLEVFLTLFCSICFLWCFLAEQANKFPIFVEASQYCAIFVFILATVLLILLPMKLKKKNEVIRTDQYIIALLSPVIVLFEIILIYGAAHF